MATYNADAIQAAIDRDPAIGPAEAKAIHALLRGRTRPEPSTETGKCWKEEPRWSSRTGQWKVQLPGGIGTAWTKREAMAWVDNLIKDGLATEDKADFFSNVRGRK